MIRDYGEDRFAKNIAKHIVAERAKEPIETTGQLNEIIRHAIPMKIQKTSGHPSKRTFQAIRIELNHELDVLRDSLDDMIDMLNPGGTDLHHHISFAGGQDREERISEKRKSMYLSKRLSGMCLWEDIKRESGHKEADPSVRGGDGVQQPFKKRKIKDI